MKPILDSFFKYQSLGNDFILVDWSHHTHAEISELVSHPTWRQTVVTLCKPHQGVGADGVVLLTKDEKTGLPRATMFNARSGQDGKFCLNGLRCLAHYLRSKSPTTEQHPIAMGDEVISYDWAGPESLGETVTTHHRPGFVNEAISIRVEDEELTGHIVDVGNPHLIILERRGPGWLTKFGPLIQNHEIFRHGINITVACKLKQPGDYALRTFERGCGLTQACSSASLAFLSLLFHHGALNVGQKNRLKQPGGILWGCLTADGSISLSAPASTPYRGQLQAPVAL